MVNSRIDKALAIQFPTYSRTYFQQLIEQGYVLVNGTISKKRNAIKENDLIEIFFQPPPQSTLVPEEIPLNVVYEDDHLIAINKESGMVTHPAPGHPSKTLVQALLHHCLSLPDTDALRPGIVHRLDKDTSGILIAAKTGEAHQKLVELFRQRKIEKKYLAISIGSPGDREIDAAIKRHPVRRKEMSVEEKGKPSLTLCKEITFNGTFALVQVLLMTGRTHQIRVHLKHNGTPILGDPIYGYRSWNQKYKIERTMLHAYQLTFIHPFTQNLMNIIAQPPSDFSEAVSRFFNTNFF